MVSVSLLAEPLHLRQRKTAEAPPKSILGRGIWMRTNEQSLFVCMKLASSGRLGSFPGGAAQRRPDWHPSTVPVPWLTGCANRERTGRQNTRSCICVGNATSCLSLSKPISTWVRNLPTSLSRWRRGHLERKRRKEIFFLFSIKVRNETWESAFLIYNESQWGWNQCLRKINRSKALSFSECNRAGIVSWTLWDISVTLTLTVLLIAHSLTQTHTTRPPTIPVYNKALMRRYELKVA